MKELTSTLAQTAANLSSSLFKVCR